MTAIATARDDALTGIQPFDARKHLRQVAELVAQVFASELDANGRSALQEMETIGRWSPVLGTILSTSFFAEFISGYVWIEDGRVVGNVTLQRQEDSGTRWRISNVAVATGYRRRGIARNLMLATLREIAQRGGSWALLQVRIDNPGPRRLYENLGFANVCQNGIWYAPSVQEELPQANPALNLVPLRNAAWRARFDLAQAARPALAHWAEPVYADAFRPGSLASLRQLVGDLVGWQHVRRWGLWVGDVLMGEVQVIANGAGDAHHLTLAVRPDAPQGTAQALLSQGLCVLQPGAPRGVVAEYDGELPEPIQLLESAGFRPRRVLLTMRRLMTPGDANLRVSGLERGRNRDGDF
jgi:ribosomal protein S18 acetylase RimI-like enzyme